MAREDAGDGWRDPASLMLLGPGSWSSGASAVRNVSLQNLGAAQLLPGGPASFLLGSRCGTEMPKRSPLEQMILSSL